MRLGRSALIVGTLTLAACGSMAGPTPSPRAQNDGKAGDDRPATPKLAEDKAKEKEKPKIPGQALWNLVPLLERYTVLSTEFDRDKWQVTYALEAKDVVKCPGYHAVFRDPDKVQVADIDLTFAPAKKEYAKGARVTVILKLPHQDDLAEVSTITVRAYE
jgi:hypothetical protein